jgi:hypothetical protein
MSTRRTATSNPEDGEARAEKVDNTLEKVQQCLDLLIANSSGASPSSSGSNSRGYKVREPDAYDGSPDSNLRRFLSQVSLVFKDLPNSFPDDEKKVNYAISHLRGAASAWIEPFLEKPDLPAWGSDFELFSAEIKRVFGHTDNLVKIVHELTDLRQTGSVPAFAVDFRQIASHLTWPDQPLMTYFYNGLQDSIRAELVKSKNMFDMTLEDFITLAVNTELLQVQEQSSKRHHSRPGRKLPASDSPSESSRAAAGRPGSRPARSNDNRTFRRLTEKEKNYRREHNLCLYCGAKGHSLVDCPTRSPSRPPSTRPAGAVATPHASGKDHAQLK